MTLPVGFPSQAALDTHSGPGAGPYIVDTPGTGPTIVVIGHKRTFTLAAWNADGSHGAWQPFQDWVEPQPYTVVRAATRIQRTVVRQGGRVEDLTWYLAEGTTPVRRNEDGTGVVVEVAQSA